MHYKLDGHISVILMSRRRDAAYRDRIEQDGQVLIYEGHDLPKGAALNDPKTVDQPRENASGSLTQNGLFEKAALDAKRGVTPPEIVVVYEKIHRGIWAFNGFFKLTDAWTERDARRSVFKFRLEIAPSYSTVSKSVEPSSEQTRLIPSAVKLEVWTRDRGCCVICGAKDNLHFDHDLPFSKGGTSLTARNIRILCARHNLSKGAKIQ
jgi:hypothetical protein